MTEAAQHLSDDCLKQLLREYDDEPSGVEFAQIHLDDCPVCRERLERLSTDSRWTNREGFVRSTVELLERTGVYGEDGPDHQCKYNAREHLQAAERELLDPPRHPELLGRLAHYDIESVIGRGGMGVVYKGFDTQLHRTVAIKVLLPHLANNGAARQRFQREARAAAGICHDNVVEIFQIHANAKHPFLVMKYVQGDSLQKWVEQNGTLTSEAIARYSMQIAEGLYVAHEQGLVHRDIKPANILRYEYSERVYITDFGLARTIDDANFTCTGLIVGTPHYMSPEQCNGLRAESSSDLFGLGCLMYFLATGRPPFRGESSMSVMNRICHAEHRPVQDINPSIANPLANVIDKLLAKDADQRFSSAAETASVLKQVLAHLQKPDRIAAPRFNLVRRKTKKPRKSWLKKIVGIGLLIGSSFIVGQSANLFDSQKPTNATSVPDPDEPRMMTVIAENDVPTELTVSRAGDLTTIVMENL